MQNNLKSKYYAWDYISRTTTMRDRVLVYYLFFFYT